MAALKVPQVYILAIIIITHTHTPCKHTYVYTRTYTCMHTHAHVHTMHTHIHTHTCTHTHTHTHNLHAINTNDIPVGNKIVLHMHCAQCMHSAHPQTHTRLRLLCSASLFSQLASVHYLIMRYHAYIKNMKNYNTIKTDRQ